VIFLAFSATDISTPQVYRLAIYASRQRLPLITKIREENQYLI